MTAAQAGDRPAYEALLRDCVPLIRRTARRAGVQADRVDDVVQDVLLTLHRVRHTYDPGRSFTAWLDAIARSRSVDDLRRRGRTERREVADELAYQAHPDRASTPEEVWQEAGRAADLRDAVSALPAGQREAVEALALRELSLPEAALQTGKSAGALKVSLHRALKTLRDRLREGR